MLGTQTETRRQGTPRSWLPDILSYIVVQQLEGDGLHEGFLALKGLPQSPLQFVSVRADGLEQVEVLKRTGLRVRLASPERRGVDGERRSVKACYY